MPALVSHRARRLVAGAVTLTALGLVGPFAAGCSATPTTTAPAASAPAAAPLTVRDAYVKTATKDGSMAMSAIFGTLANSGSSPVTVVKGTSDAATTVELHEMVMEGGAMKMRQKDGGLVVPANGTLALEPGGLHVMLIGLTRDIRAGETVTAQLTLSDGATVEVSAVARDLPNANESYAPGS